MTPGTTDIDALDEDRRLTLLDNIRYRPTREQWRGTDTPRAHNGTYRACLFFSLFGITSARWDRLTHENRARNSRP